MQHMQDKEFDQLFRDRFEGEEIQPSANLWNNISEELVVKPKRKLPIYWMAAAVAMITVTVILLRPETETIKLQAVSTTAAKFNVDTPKTAVKILAQAGDRPSISQDNKMKSTPLVIAPRAVLSNNEKELAALQPSTVNDRPVNKQPEVVTEIAKAEPKIEAPVQEKMMANADVTSTGDEVINETEHQENKGIRNVGDLVNFVVNKVDKREKKFIKFDTDDDNSSLVSINIGFLKFNKKSDK